MSFNKILTLAALACAGVVQAGSATQAAPAPLRTHLVVEKVRIPHKHALGAWGPWGESVSCSAFTGTYEGSALTVRAEATGGSGGYEHTIMTQFNSSYRLGTKQESQFQDRRRGNGHFEVQLPSINDEVPYVQQTILLSTRDSSGQMVTDTVTFNVSRPVVLAVSDGPAARANNCFQRYTPYEAMTGVLSNATNNLSTIEIRQGIQKLWTSTHGWQWGVFVAPLDALKLGNLLALNFAYFRETSKTVAETTEVNTQYSLDPGDYMQVYAQPTRYVTAYDASLVEPCGRTTTNPGGYMFQWWGFAYHVFPINPYSGKAPALESIGAPVMNTCSSAQTSDSNAAQEFRRMN